MIIVVSLLENLKSTLFTFFAWHYNMSEVFQYDETSRSKYIQIHDISRELGTHYYRGKIS